MTFLADHNLEGQASILWDILSLEGWLDLLPLRLVTLHDVGLSHDSSDREVWRFAQTHELVLLTANRQMRGADSLEITIRQENRADSLPVVTVGNVARLVNQKYRVQCAVRLVEIALDIESYLGAGRVYIP